MNDRLAPLIFLPLPISTPWSVTLPASAAASNAPMNLVRAGFDLPLFWYEPPWHAMTGDVAGLIATAVAQLGVAVSALGRDLAGADGRSPFLREPAASGDREFPDTPLPRIVPYRAERYGLCATDFDDAAIIDVRLVTSRDANGRFAYSPAQIQRWEATPDSHPLAGGGWVWAATFPPDVPAVEQLHSKLSQLRALAPTAAVFVSMEPYRLQSELATVIAQKPDGIILRCDDDCLDGLGLATITHRVRRSMDQSGASKVPLWIVPGIVSPDDVVKLMSLGAAGVAIDHWCNPLVDQVGHVLEPSTAQRLGYSSPASSREAQFRVMVTEALGELIERFEGLTDSLLSLPADQRLATLEATWAKRFGIEQLSFDGES